MILYSLSGPSGTGKSTVALSFAHDKKIPAIIDDGLLILNGQKIAGTSAKTEKNPFRAVKRAIFFNEDHAREIRLALAHYYIDKLLIIGTSDKMVRLIAKNLELGEIDHYYHIEDIRSSSEIKIAQFIRKTEGKHVIPIPVQQVEQSFFKSIIQKGKEIFSPRKEKIGETTIVHPEFHRGHIEIRKNVFRDITSHICSGFSDIKECKAVNVNLDGVPILNLTILIMYPFNGNVTEMTKELQEEIYQQFLKCLSIELYSIHINIQMG